MAEESGSKKKLIIIVAALVGVLIIGAAVFFIFFTGGDDGSATETKKSDNATQNDSAANYVPLTKPLTGSPGQKSMRRSVKAPQPITSIPSRVSYPTESIALSRVRSNQRYLVESS